MGGGHTVDECGKYAVDAVFSQTGPALVETWEEIN